MSCFVDEIKSGLISPACNPPAQTSAPAEAVAVSMVVSRALAQANPGTESSHWIVPSTCVGVPPPVQCSDESRQTELSRRIVVTQPPFRPQDRRALEWWQRLIDVRNGSLSQSEKRPVVVFTAAYNPNDALYSAKHLISLFQATTGRMVVVKVIASKEDWQLAIEDIERRLPSSVKMDLIFNVHGKPARDQSLSKMRFNAPHYEVAGDELAQAILPLQCHFSDETKVVMSCCHSGDTLAQAFDHALMRKNCKVQILAPKYPTCPHIFIGRDGELDMRERKSGTACQLYYDTFSRPKIAFPSEAKHPDGKNQLLMDAANNGVFSAFNYFFSRMKKDSQQKALIALWDHENVNLTLNRLIRETPTQKEMDDALLCILHHFSQIPLHQDENICHALIYLIQHITDDQRTLQERTKYVQIFDMMIQCSDTSDEQTQSLGFQLFDALIEHVIRDRNSCDPQSLLSVWKTLSADLFPVNEGLRLKIEKNIKQLV